VSTYLQFLDSKRLETTATGMPPPQLHPELYPFQRESVRWALRQGKSALFFDCGLGKTFMQIAWAHAVTRHVDRPVLILAPLAVSLQTRAEGERFNLPVAVVKSRSDVPAGPGVYVTNYERLEKFDAGAFGGVVLDESSILKSYMGKTKRALMEAFRRTPFKLCCTATPAPNDHLELGNHCEFLDVMTSHEMLARWFVNDLETFGTYRLKGHAEISYWDWMASWSRAAATPSDLGYSDGGYILPDLTVTPVLVDVDLSLDRAAGQLFRMPEMSATAIHKERRRTADARARAVAELIAAEPDESWLVWVDTNYEAAALRPLVPGVVEVSGSDTLKTKEQRLLGFSHGEIGTLMTKPKIAGFGLNWQHCARVAFLGPTFSYESYYQAVRRVWRFGQARPVQVYVAMAPTERHVYDIMRSKAAGHIAMQQGMRGAMRRAQAESSPMKTYTPNRTAEPPSWLA